MDNERVDALPTPAPAAATAPATAPAPAPAPAIQYDVRPPSITRRQVNFFLILLFVNTLLFAAFVCLPSASPWLKDIWTNYQHERERKKEQAAIRSVVNACMDHTAPADQLVYAEPAPDAAKLLTESGRARTVGDLTRRSGGGGGLFSTQTGTTAMLASAGWHAPAIRGAPEPLIDLHRRNPADVRRVIERSGAMSRQSSDASVFFLHALKSPGGKQRLVWVFVIPAQELVEDNSDPANPKYEISTRRRLAALVFDPQDLSKHTRTTILFAEPDAARTRLLIKPAPEGKKDQVILEPRSQWRIYAGQPDPDDPTHLTIRYQIDGNEDFIDGRLNDNDRLMLTPRAGRLLAWTSGDEYTWDLGTPPATTEAAPAPTR